MRRLKDLFERGGDPDVRKFLLLLAQATLRELDNPAYDALGLRNRALEFAQDDIESLKRFLAASGYEIGEDGIIRTRGEEAQPSEEDLDPVTGIPWKRWFDAAGQHLWDQCARDGIPVAAVLVDLDNLKTFNDHHSYETGNTALKAVALVLEATVKSRGVYGRYLGGDELGAFVRNLTEEEAIALAERIRRLVEAMKVENLPLSVSIGIASTAGSPADGPEFLMQRAQIALKTSKARGKNSTTGFRQIQD
jgi:diguanylate cyclase (GGDEF)-like protein